MGCRRQCRRHRQEPGLRLRPWLPLLRRRQHRSRRTRHLRRDDLRLDRDAVDRRIILTVQTRTGRIIASQNDVGGWPSLPINRQVFQTPLNPNGDDDRDGYTNLEEVLHQAAAPLEG